MNTTQNPSQTGTWRGWTEPTPDYEHDPLEDVLPCPHCGELPEWERDGRFSSRYRLNCCGINSIARGHYKDHEIDAVTAWNGVVEWERECIQWRREADETETRHAEEDAWADENLPMLA